MFCSYSFHDFLLRWLCNFPWGYIYSLFNETTFIYNRLPYLRRHVPMKFYFVSPNFLSMKYRRVVSPISRCPKSNTLGQWRRNQNDSLNLGLYYTLESFSFSIVVYYVLESKPTKAPARLCLRYFLKHCYA